ncbi:MAG: flavodoxin domain-containing protein [Chloroflexi bacterium]|nr:flavodoxin domain-containing protein [Chloroflexota bacterium]
MKIEIVYDSSTGTTAAAAEAMGKTLEHAGHECRVQSVNKANPTDVTEADLICVGSWVKGWFIVKQHPTPASLRFIRELGDLDGKKVVVFCTYKVAIGSTLRQMAAAFEQKGATVVGHFKYRGPEPDGKFGKFAKSLN